MNEATGGPRLSAGQLIAYAMPTVALQMMMVPLLLYLPPAYSSAPTGLSLSLVGLMFLLGRLFELVSDPLIGAWSDRTRGRFGRRRPWMALGLPLASVAAVFLVSPPPGATAWYLATWLILFYLGWTMVFIPHQTWGGEISNNYQERTRIAGYRETGAFIGYLLASLVPAIYWQWLVGVTAPTFPQIVQVIGLFFAVALPLAVVVCFARVPAGEAEVAERQPSWREFFAILRRNAPFARLASSYLFDRLAMGIYFAAQPFFIGLVLDLQQYVLLVALTNTAAAAALAWLWVLIARRLGKHQTYVLANVVTACAYALLFFVPSGPGALFVVLAAQVLMGFGNGGTMIAPPAMAADTVDHDELQSGARQMGGHMAFLAIVFKGGIMLGAPLAFAVMASFGFEGRWGALSETQSQSIRLCASVLPAVLLLIPIAAMWRFPLDATRHASICRELQSRRATIPTPQAPLSAAPAG
jgi:Na+/melibiose symporter-like transporter